MRYSLLLATVLSMLCLLMNGGAAGAASGSVTIVSAGGATPTFVVQGNVNGVAGFEAVITYDKTTLGSPVVTQGSFLPSGGLFAANPNYATNQVKIAFVQTTGFSGTGPLATITFVPVGKNWKTPTVIASLIDANGQAASGSGGGDGGSTAGGLWTSPTGTKSTPDQTTTPPLTTGNTGNTTSAGTAGWPGTISLGGETSTGSEPSRQVAAEPPPPVPVVETPRTTPPPDTTPAKPREKLVLPPPPANVLERFRTYKGERTVAALQPLFTQRGGSWIVQEPAIARADGATLVTVLITLERMGLEAPNFALRSLELKALKTVAESGWAIEGIPAAGALQATISMLLDDAATDIPLVVVPPLKGQWVGKKLTEAEVNRFLAERGTDKAPLGDLNNDGRRDYRDDYIMIGNYLLAASPTKGKAAPVPAQQKPTAVPATAATGKQAAPDQK